MRSIAKLAIVLLLSAVGWAQSTYLPYDSWPIVVGTSAGSSLFGVTCALNNLTSGQLIVYSSNWEGGSGNPAVSDSAGSTIGSPTVANTANNVRVAIWAFTVAASGTDTITPVLAGASFQNVSCTAYPANWSASDGSCSGGCAVAYSGTPASVTTPTMVTTKNSDLLYAHVGGFRSGGKMILATSNWYQTGYVTGADSAGSAYTIAGAAGSYTATFTNTGPTNDQGAIAIIALSPPAITIASPGNAPDGALTKSYDWFLQAAGGVGAYTWSCSGVPTGLTLNTSTGEITGTPTVSNNYTMSCSVHDTVPTTATASIAVKIATTALTPTVVQSKVAAADPPASTLAFTSNVTAGNTSIALYNYITFNGVSNFYDTNTCTDTVGTPYKRLGIARVWVNTSPPEWKFIQISAGTIPSSGANTVNCSSVNGGYVFTISELSNVGYISADNSLLTTGTTASPATVTSSSLTTLVPGEFLYAGGLCFTASCTMTGQSPFTHIGPAFELDGAYEVTSTVTGYTASFAMTGNSNPWAIYLVGLRPSGGTVVPPAANAAHSFWW